MSLLITIGLLPDNTVLYARNYIISSINMPSVVKTFSNLSIEVCVAICIAPTFSSKRDKCIGLNYRLSTKVCNIWYHTEDEKSNMTITLLHRKDSIVALHKDFCWDDMLISRPFSAYPVWEKDLSFNLIPEWNGE